MTDRARIFLYLAFALWVAALYCFRYGFIGYFFALALALSRHCFLNAGAGWSEYFVLDLFVLAVVYGFLFAPALILSQLYDTYRILQWRQQVLAAHSQTTPGVSS